MKSKKILALILSVMMIVSLLTPFSAFAADVTSGTCGDSLTWSYDSGSGALIISGTGAMYDYEARTTPWIHLQNNIYSVDIQEGVTTIGNWAFAYCYYARMANLPEESLTSIGMNAFYQCISLEEVLIPETVTTLGAAPFAYCKKLQAVAIPTSVQSLGKYTFIDCASLKTIYYAGSQSDWDGISKDATDAPYYAQATIMVDTAAGTTWAFDSTTKTLTIGGYGRMKNYNARTTPWYDDYANIKHIVVEEGVTGLGNWAFAYMFYAEDISLPSTLVHIGASAFYNCTTLPTIDLPDGLTRLFSGAFYNCKKLDNITIPVGVDTIYANTFAGCAALTNVSFNGTKTQWSKVSILTNNAELTALEVNCLVKSIEWTLSDDGVLTISGGVAMDDYELKTDPMAPWAAVKADVKKVVIEDGIPNIGKNAFYGCSNLTEVVIPNSVTSIGYGAFWACYGLESIVLPTDLTYLGGAAFYACTALKDITVPSSLESVLAHTFYNNNALTTVYYVGTEEQYNEMTVAATNNQKFIDATVVYLDEHPNAGGTDVPVDPDEPVETFEDWTYADGVLTINANTPAFETGATPWAEYAGEITTVVFAEGVTELGAYTFENLAIESIILPEGLTTVPANAFAGCVALTDVTLPASVTDVEENAFADTAALTTVYFDGTADDYADITVADGNDTLTAAEVVYTGKPGGGIELPDFDF